MITCILLWVVIKYLPVWSTTTDQAIFGEKYSKSQYVLGPKSTEWISDSELYVYAGYAYMLGQDPTTINFEHPPLGKYVTGISQLLFGNAYLINLGLFIILLVMTHYLASILISNEKIKALVILIFAIQPIIFSQLQFALLDMSFTISILGIFVCLHRKFSKAWLKYLSLGILLGMVAAIKYPIPFILIPSLIIGVVAFREKQIQFLLFTGLGAVTVYLLSYTLYFYHDHSLVDFLSFEKYRYVWWTGDRTMPKFLIFQNLFTGHYPAWWDGGAEQITKEWNIMLPALFSMFVFSFIWVKRKFWNVLIASFGFIMILVYGYASAAALSYLTLLIPFWLVTVGAVVEEALLIKSKRQP